LRKHGLKINLPKSFFGTTEVSFLGFKLTPDEPKPGVNKLKAVAAAKPPNDITKVSQLDRDRQQTDGEGPESRRMDQTTQNLETQ
jgi:hypothetical protein